MGEGNEVDNELNAIMEGNFGNAPAKEQTPTSQGANPVSEKTYEAAGRKWKGEDLAKSHDSLVREMGSRNKDWEELKYLREVKANLAKDPEFAQHFQKSIREYQERKAAGQSSATAARNAQLPPEIAAKLEKVDRFEKLADRMEYDREVTDVTRKFKLSDEDLRKVEDYSLAHGGLELEASYKQMSFDLNQQGLAQRKEAEVAARKKVSQTSGPTPDNAIPSLKNVSLKGDADWRKAAGSEISKYFQD